MIHTLLIGALAAQITLCTPNKLPGDINGDCKVDLTDVSLLSSSYGQQAPHIKTPAADINLDGKVDLTDFSILANNFGKTITQ